MAGQGDTNYKHPKNVRLRLSLFWVNNYFGDSYQAMIRRTDEMVKEHNLGLDCWPSVNKDPLTSLDGFDNGRLIETTDYDALRARADNIVTSRNRAASVIVIFCNFKDTANGLNVRGTSANPMCLISPGLHDGIPLLHELGHAAGMGHDHTATDAQNRNFMAEAAPRTRMYQWQIKKLATSFFTL